jgi:hypothetical protein
MAEEITEGAKAVQEAAKATGKALDLLHVFGGWVGKVVGDPVAEAVGFYVTDRIQAARLERAIFDKARLHELLKRLQSNIGDRSIKVRPLPPKVALPLLEAATMEYEDDLLSLWAKLLETAIDDDSMTVERQYVSILTELSSTDAEALQDFWVQSFEPYDRKRSQDGLKTLGPSIDTTMFGDHVAANLTRLGILTAGYIEFNIYEPGGENRYGSYGPEQEKVQVPGDFRFAVFTDLGRDFCRALGMRDPPIRA